VVNPVATTATATAPVPPESGFIAEFSDYGGFVDGLRARVAELNVAGHTIDHVAGLPAGYALKILGSRPVKRIGPRSMGDLLGALGLKAQLIEDPEAFARVAGRLIPRKPRQGVRNGVVQVTYTKRFFRKIGLIGGRLSRKNMSKRQASALGRKAAAARWHRRGAAPSLAG
jgi:hypothetical protein